MLLAFGYLVLAIILLGDLLLPEGLVRPTSAVNANLEHSVELLAFTTPQNGYRPGDTVQLTLYWRALRSELPDYFVYVRAVDGGGQIQAKTDSPPVMGFWPTSRWEGGKLVADEQVLTRPPETEPGTYRLEIGMYDPQTWAVLEPGGGPSISPTEGGGGGPPSPPTGGGGGLLLGEVTLP